MTKTSSNIVLLQALDVFRVNGYHKTSMADIGSACGLLKGSIYHYFPSKEVLALEVMQLVIDYFDSQIFILAYDETKPACERLVNFTEAVFDYFTGHQGGCLMGNFALEVSEVLPQFREIIQGYFVKWSQALAHILRYRYDEENAIQLAEDAVAKTQGAIMMMRLYNNSDFLKRVNQQIASLLD